ncbi:saccharopine dehydrogenase family protein [Emcibacter nanhaiensis]|uniref:Saccharopine dehydrogenase n=1 Tax=Emcibacter nanhaiensis TaxID=1505037 RepID=A0A501PBY2_9PROT|nr:saccharopine dehydrogenase family protein [Emcibacter nanhaiensis]TPD57698.1 saccharopine dehydrogenase [Emcibacter nanhaiensis]
MTPSPAVPDRPSLHWVGAGLSSGPGIVALARQHADLTVWDVSPDRVKELRLLASLDIGWRRLNLDDEQLVEEFRASLTPGDVVVSMLPAALHADLAELVLARGCHVVTSSYVSPEMQALDGPAREAGVALVNEVGLDPGIDHLFAHLVVAAAQSAGLLGKDLPMKFVSYCGGVPAEPDAFTYKFSWTPLGVLTALKNQARFLAGGAEQVVDKAWEAVSRLDIAGETFEVYPNRNSLPYIEDYGLDGEAGLKDFVRGTLRLEGWKQAWAEIFTQVESADLEALKQLSAQLQAAHSYGEGEEDRVVLYVALEIDAGEQNPWRAALALDEKGSGWQTAMARTVSLTVARAAESVLAGDFRPGVHAAISDPALCRRWLADLKAEGLNIRAENIPL